MRNHITIWLGVLILVGLSLTIKAQDKSVELTDVEDKLIQTVEKEVPGWTHQTVKPIQGSQDVAIDQWISDNKGIRVTIIRHSSQEEAVKSIREFAADMKAGRDIPDAGEEQYSFDDMGSIVFRKRHFTIYLTVKSTDPEGTKKMRKQIARIAADAIGQTH